MAFSDDYAHYSQLSRLLPNESADTDVILLGHSMGGILSAEVTFLLSSPSFTTGTQKFRHQILGTINFDCPFLGMHPGVVVSGIGSLFRSAPTSPGAQNLNAYSEDQLSELNPSNGRRASSPSLNPLSLSHSNQEPGSSSGASYMVDVSCPPGAFEASGTQGATEIRPYTRLSPSDPNYNPPFPNDVRLPERTGWVNALHFLNKHSHDLTKAASAYVTSHLDFGGCLADYKGLKNRYTKLRALENTKTVPDNSRRIRFLNYYTACTGRPKNTKLMAGGGPYTRAAKIPSAAQLVTNQHLQDLQGIQNLSLSATSTRSPIPSPRISIEEHRDGEVHPKALEDPEVLQSMREENPPSDGRTVDLKDGLTEHPADQSTSQHRLSNESESLASTLAKPDDSHSLPPPPPFPVWPLSYDPAAYPDKTTRNLAHKKYTTEFKSHMQALKAYDKSINQRLKLLDKQDDRDDRAKKSTKTKKPPAPSQLVKASPPKNKEPAPASSSSLLSIKPAEKEDSSHEYDDNDGSSVGGGGGGAETKPPPKRDRRFCVVPSRINGQMDPCWVRVFMNGVDEVGAHCGLFVPGEHYGWLVDDVGGRIQGWVEEM